jgi:hypothetical protein
MHWKDGVCEWRVASTVDKGRKGSSSFEMLVTEEHTPPRRISGDVVITENRPTRRKKVL